tara:strand:- start:98 stop:391 length:294 start_codon:yes stop_codon:yes gene_type:complete
MTCFWDGILNTLTNDDFEKFNKKTRNVIWNNEKFSKKQLDENFTHIKDFDYKSIRNGYDCSTYDPFLILICELFKVNINHDYIGNMIKYKNTNSKKH